MRFIVAALALLLPIAAHAQTAQVQPQLGLDKSGTCRRVTVYDPQKAGTDKMVPLGCVDSSSTFQPTGLANKAPLANAALSAPTITGGTITGGTVTGITDLAVADGGTGASTAAGARTNLGIGTVGTYSIGTSGATVPLLSTANLWSLAQSFGNGWVAYPNTDNQVSSSGASLELGSVGRAVAGPAYVDFHSSVGSPDFDARILSSGGSSSTIGQGALTVQAGSLTVPALFGSTGSFSGAVSGTRVQVDPNFFLSVDTGGNPTITFSSSAAFAFNRTLGTLSLSNGGGMVASFDMLGNATFYRDVVSNTGAVIQKVGGAPASSTAACTPGQQGWDASYEYRCVASGSWRRVALTTF
jgi:hypothetical protein